MTHLPTREQVLRALFWKLLFRGRAAHEAGAHRLRKQISMGLTLCLYGAVGAVPAIGAFFLPPFAFASSLHVMTLLFASLTLASNMGTMLFVREEAEILLHRPVRAEELLRAKCFVLVSFALLLALALNAGGLVTSFWNQGNAWWFPVAHCVTTLLLMLFSAASIVLVYNVVLRWWGRERFENLLTFVQVMVTVVMVVGAQIVPRVLDTTALQQLASTSVWALLLPPLWFAALDMLLCGVLPWHAVWLPAAIGLMATGVITWLAFVKLGSAYGAGLLALNETTSVDRDRSRRRWIDGLLRLPPLRWWLRDAIERQAFLLTSAYLVRDRETKLKIFPALVPLVVMPVVVALGPGRRSDRGPSAMLDTMVFAYVAIVPIQALIMLRRSEHWRAADLFRVAPIGHWTPLFHGARKAVVWWIAVPCLLAIAVLLGALRGTWSPFAMVLPALVMASLSSYVPGVIGEWLPLAQPNSDQRDSAIGCLLYGGVMMVAMAVGGLGEWMQSLGLTVPFLLGAVALGLSLQVVWAKRMRARPWYLAGDWRRRHTAE